MKNIQLLTTKVLELLAEVETYSFHKQNLVRSLKKLFSDYQNGKYTYFQYEKAQKKLLKGRTKEEWINYYNSYILSLLKRIEAYNSQIFYEAYNDRRFEHFQVVKPKPVPKPVPKPAHKESPKPAPVHKAATKHEPEPKPEHVPKHEPVHAEPADLKETASEQLDIEPKLVEIKPSIFDRITLFFKHFFIRKEVEARLDEIKAAKPELADKPVAKPVHVKETKQDLHKAHEPEVKKKSSIVKKPSWFRKLFPFLFADYKRESIFDKSQREKAEEKQERADAENPEKKSSGVSIGNFLGLEHLFKLINRKQKVEFSEEKSAIPVSTIQLETLRRKAKPEISTQIEKITATSLTKEARRIRNIMDKRKSLKIYQPSFFGAVANVAIKKISLFLLDQFPDFFKDLYHALRLANIKILSNTYVNMMVLGVLASSVIGLFLFGFFFAASALPLDQMLFRTLMMSVLSGLAAFAGFYAYPYSKMKSRRRSINTNLPFAINHMAAVSSSGVAPVKMFKLISESKEYGEISIEIEKIVNYIEIFGYDVLTALKAVAATTPSYQFKDFFEGMVSTTQTGGDLKSYFAQKAEESMLNYKLERQKYTETIATYSDIYTGILIAAPLFFVAALSLVSLLGGQVGGMDVNVIIVIGTYVVIPLMNVSFLAFLEITQPEV